MARLVADKPTILSAACTSFAEHARTRLIARPVDQCPLNFTNALLRCFHTESCGKCTPCRIGVSQACMLIDKILDGEADASDLEKLKSLAPYIREVSDCAIGVETGALLERALIDFEADFQAHLETGQCAQTRSFFSPCQQSCPAHIDIPAYIALVEQGRYVDALRVIRNDNPLPAVCGYVCEHPCEPMCRRTLKDAPVNICGLKRFADDHAEAYDPQPCAPKTGKRIAIIGGGPAGLSAAYYLQLMGHDCTIFEALSSLGGMTRFGIPDYRLPQKVLQRDIDFILKTGVQTRLNCKVGKDISYQEILENFDASYLAIGAQGDKKLGIAGEDAAGVMSAVEFLQRAALRDLPDLSDKRVVVIGGGNVAMDCTRTARRLTREKVVCAYRRRIADMTAQAEEIEEALAENCQITELVSPLEILVGENGAACGVRFQPQIIGEYRAGRPSPRAAAADSVDMPADLVLVAIGQDIQTEFFAEYIQTQRGKIMVDETGRVMEGYPAFAGGDATLGPKTVIAAIAQGKLAAANIDQALGYSHKVYDAVDIPRAQANRPACGRVELKNLDYQQAAQSFDLAKYGMSKEEAEQECSRCLRCDHFGFGAQFEGDTRAW